MAQQHDLSALSSFLNQAMLDQQQGQQPLVVNDNPDTAGMSFAELFSHYLAPEVAKLPTTAASSSDALPAPFTFGAPSPSGSANTANGFDPSTFMPTIPGSPIGAFSPSSTDGNSVGRSPMSFPDLDFLGTADDAFAIDPSVFGAPPSLTPASTTGSTLPSPAASIPLDLGFAPLPPLPDLPLPPTSTAAASAPLELLQPAAHIAQPHFEQYEQQQQYTASGRPKRHVVSTIVEEEDEDAYLSDGGLSDSSVLTSATAETGAGAGSRKSTRAKKPAAKKARSGSSGASASPKDSKKLPRTSVQPLASDTLHKTTARSSLPPVPQWADKPDPDEYAKLSSKEKRQLRNKLSARNFRHRRKEYITTLEEEISSRDTLITSLRDEVGVIRAENTGLRSEVATLKEKWQDLLDKLSSLTPPQPGGVATAGLGVNPSRAVAAAAGAGGVHIKQEEGIVSPESAPAQLPPSTQGNAVASTSSSGRIGTRSSSSQLQLPNLAKDVSSTGRRGWSTMPGAGGFMSVHTTFLPDVNDQLAAGLNPKPALPFSTQSFNPALNALNAAGQLDDLASYTSHLRSSPSPAAQQQGQPKGTFEDFFASNPYWLRPDQLDAQRAALYGKLANNAAGLVVAQKTEQQRQASSSPGSSASGESGDGYLPLPAGFRPAFFRSGKALPSASSSPSPFSATGEPSDLLAFQSPSTAAALSVSHADALALRQQATMATVAAAAQKTLLQRLGGAFWDAFAGAPAPASVSGGQEKRADVKGKGRELDPAKVAAVLSGRARVEVVPSSSSPASKAAGVEDLSAALGSLNLATGRAASPSPRREHEAQLCAFDEVCRVWTQPEAVAVKKEEA
ncbi:hypothetical protein JCM8097_008162 [Rhodosporidiobolus ruineniae]